MKIVIDIPEENYERLKAMYEMGALNNPYLMTIANGTPLGDLPLTVYAQEGAKRWT